MKHNDLSRPYLFTIAHRRNISFGWSKETNLITVQISSKQWFLKHHTHVAFCKHIILLPATWSVFVEVNIGLIQSRQDPTVLIKHVTEA